MTAIRAAHHKAQSSSESESTQRTQDAESSQNSDTAQGTFSSLDSAHGSFLDPDCATALAANPPEPYTIVPTPATDVLDLMHRALFRWKRRNKSSSRPMTNLSLEMMLYLKPTIKPLSVAVAPVAPAIAPAITPAIAPAIALPLLDSIG
ncbi:hypothetical protein EDC01DRAFT_781045 [Geopyxis carbonaria]|nr:hypothetical protein EDC01DRAFT_781045 [Geopyxis carbonaria]